MTRLQLIAGTFDPAIGEFGEPAAVPSMHRSMRRPLPAAKTGTLIIHEGLLQFVPAVHDKRAVLGDGFVDGPALQQQYLGPFATVPQLHAGIRRPDHAVPHGNFLTAPLQAVPVAAAPFPRAPKSRARSPADPVTPPKSAVKSAAPTKEALGAFPDTSSASTGLVSSLKSK